MNMVMDITHRYSTEQAINMVMDIRHWMQLLLTGSVDMCSLDLWTVTFSMAVTATFSMTMVMTFLMTLTVNLPMILTVTFSMTVTFSVALSGFLDDNDSDFLVDNDSDHLDDSDFLQVDSEKQTCIPSTGLHQPATMYKQKQTHLILYSLFLKMMYGSV